MIQDQAGARNNDSKEPAPRFDDFNFQFTGFDWRLLQHNLPLAVVQPFEIWWAGESSEFEGRILASQPALCKPDFATLRADSIKRLAVGLSVRFLSVISSTGCLIFGNLIGKILIGGC